MRWDIKTKIITREASNKQGDKGDHWCKCEDTKHNNNNNNTSAQMIKTHK